MNCEERSLSVISTPVPGLLRRLSCSVSRAVPQAQSLGRPPSVVAAEHTHGPYLSLIRRERPRSRSIYAERVRPQRPTSTTQPLHRHRRPRGLMRTSQGVTTMVDTVSVRHHDRTQTRDYTADEIAEALCIQRGAFLRDGPPT